ncbi:50S ribosomal protein L6 [Candidatus Uhrbacteria bacterium]|nr:50S ribosomal protein L6 [Candidatus Uhrbacteria bacterium]
MSRIGKKPVLLPAAVNVTIGDTDAVITGPKGSVTVRLPAPTRVTFEESPRSLVVSVPNPDEKTDKSVWGLTRQLLSNAVAGVQTPFETSLELVGVGFKVALADRALTLDVGFSHSVAFPLPDGINAKVEKQVVTLSGVDKHLVGETAARLRRVRPPEPYKGKGIKYTTETIRRKAGKTATKAAS